jgi:hypothetical protein
MITHYELFAMIVVLALAMKGPVWLFKHSLIKQCVARFNRLAAKRHLSVWVVGMVSLSMHLRRLLYCLSTPRTTNMPYSPRDRCGDPLVHNA